MANQHDPGEGFVRAIFGALLGAPFLAFLAKWLTTQKAERSELRRLKAANEESQRLQAVQDAKDLNTYLQRELREARRENNQLRAKIEAQDELHETQFRVCREATDAWREQCEESQRVLAVQAEQIRQQQQQIQNLYRQTGAGVDFNGPPTP